MVAELSIEKDTGVAHVELVDVERRNAFSAELATTLRAIFEQCIADPEVRVIVLSGRGDMFCVGGNVKEFADDVRNDTVVETISRNISLFNPLLKLMVECPKVVVGALHGAVAGGGISLACTCDVRIAHPATKFVGGFLGIGLPPDTLSGWLLPRIVGIDFAREFFITNRAVGADEALRVGLVHRVDDEPVTAALNQARKLANGPVGTYARAKVLLRESMSLSVDDYLAKEVPLVMDSVRGDEFSRRVLDF